MRNWLIAIAAMTVAVPAAAQAPGVPVYNGGISSGVDLVGDLGFTNTDGGKGTAYAATGRLGLGPLGITATVGDFNASGDVPGRATYGGSLNLRVLGGPFIPLSVTLQAGYGHLGSYTSTTTELTAPAIDHVPLGVGFGFKIPSPVLSIRPWVAPRIDIARAKDPASGDSNTQTKFGVSGGIDVNTIGGFGVQLAYDRVFAADGIRPSIFGIGAHYAIRVPGL